MSEGFAGELTSRPELGLGEKFNVSSEELLAIKLVEAANLLDQGKSLVRLPAVSAAWTAQLRDANQRAILKTSTAALEQQERLLAGDKPCGGVPPGRRAEELLGRVPQNQGSAKYHPPTPRAPPDAQIRSHHQVLVEGRGG